MALSSSLSPLDMLSMSDVEQKVIRCLSKKPLTDLPVILEDVRAPRREIERALEDLIAGNKVSAEISNGITLYAIHYTKPQPRRNIPAAVWDIFDDA